MSVQPNPINELYDIVRLGLTILHPKHKPSFEFLESLWEEIELRVEALNPDHGLPIDMIVRFCQNQVLGEMVIWLVGL